MAPLCAGWLLAAALRDAAKCPTRDSPTGLVRVDFHGRFERPFLLADRSDGHEGGR